MLSNRGMSKIRSVLERLGTTALAAELNQYPSLISKWKARGSIPAGWQRRVMNAAKKMGKPIKAEDLIP